MKHRIRIGKTVPNTGAMDFSRLLDAPAGKHGFVTVRGEHFYFEDGTQARFIGFNFAVRANMPDRTAAEKISARLASMGVNLVRLTGADVPPSPKGWSSNPDYPLLNYPESTRHFHPGGLDRLDYWCACLKEKGIYLQLDLLVARRFLPQDSLDRPEALSPSKSSSHVNDRLLQLQKEYASMLLSHVNPYTGLAYKDDPAVCAIQICNEDSFFFDVEARRSFPGVAFYKAEVQERFNHFLLAKYHSREHLAEAWTWNGICALLPEEDPLSGTVRCPEAGDYAQPVNDPAGDWGSPGSPARYADYAEFGMWMNRRYYGEMIGHIRSLGTRIPVTTNCLYTGAADVASSCMGDFMQNNTYFNHPAAVMSPPGTLFVPNLREYVSQDPRCLVPSCMEPRGNLTAQAGAAVLEGKPFVLNEWNEYGEAPFHASAFLMTAAYGCLNGWDGLDIYCYTTSDNLEDQPEDEIAHIMDAYNDPSLILQFPMLSAVFLQGLVKEARNRVDIVYSENDLQTQPSGHRLPYTCLPFVSKTRSVFLTQGERYEGNADLAVTAGFVRGTDLYNASHAVLFSHSPWRDVWRRGDAGSDWFSIYKKGAEPLKGLGLPGVWQSSRFLVFDDVGSLLTQDDWRPFSLAVDHAMKHFGLLSEEEGLVRTSSDPEEAGYTDGARNPEITQKAGCPQNPEIPRKQEIFPYPDIPRTAFRSDTGEIFFDPAHSLFRIDAERIAFFTGKPEESILIGGFTIICRNERITLGLLPLDGLPVSSSGRLLVTAIGKTGMDETAWSPVDGDPSLTRVELKGKLFLETFEGSIRLPGRIAPVMTALDVYGSPLQVIRASSAGKDVWNFELDGRIPSGNFLLER